MYCPKCGTVADDDAAFCRKCGHRFGSAADSAPSSQSFPDKPVVAPSVPKEQKNNVIISFIITRTVWIAVGIVILATGGGIWSGFLSDGEYISDIYFQSLFEDSFWKTLFIISLIACILEFVITGIMLYSAAKNNTLDADRAKMNRFSSFLMILNPGALSLILGAVANISDSSEIKFSIMFFIINIIIVLCDFPFLFLYRQAADAEQYAKYRNKKTVHAAASPKPWKCPHCGNENLPSDIFCQKCGRNYGEDKDPPRSSNEMWICSSCGERNPKNIVTCRGCGKYR